MAKSRKIYNVLQYESRKVFNVEHYYLDKRCSKEHDESHVLLEGSGISSPCLILKGTYTTRSSVLLNAYRSMGVTKDNAA